MALTDSSEEGRMDRVRIKTRTKKGRGMGRKGMEK